MFGATEARLVSVISWVSSLAFIAAGVQAMTELVLGHHAVADVSGEVRP